MAPDAEPRYDGRDAHALRALLDVPSLELLATVPSVMDVAHARAASGAPGGTVVLADEQTAGRGRGGRAWRSAPRAGIWLALVERPREAAAVEVLSLRLGMAAARVLDRWSASPVRLKWPNDLFTADGKLGGILVESRWRGSMPDWVIVGIGINVVPPEGVDRPVAALGEKCDRGEVLAELVPALRAAAAAAGPLRDAELARFAERDMARGRRCTAPVQGTVRGIDSAGALVVDTAAGEARARAGSLVLEGDA